MLKQFPLPSLSPPPAIGQNLAASEEVRNVRSEKELRLAIQEIAASPATTYSSEQSSLLLKTRSAIRLAIPFPISSKVTIPETCPGLTLFSLGFAPLQIDGLAVAFEVLAPFVTFNNVSHLTPLGGQPPGVFCDLDGAAYFRSINCLCGGTTAAFRSPAGASASSKVSIHGYRGRGDFDLLVTDSGFVDCDMGDLTLQTGATGNRFSGGRINNVENNSNASNVAAGCQIEGTVSNAGTSLFEVGTGNPNVA